MEPDGSIHGFWGSKTIFGTLKPQARPDIVLFESFTGKGEPNHELLVGALTDFRTIGLGLLKDQRKRIGLEELEAKLLAQPSLRHIPRMTGLFVSNGMRSRYSISIRIKDFGRFIQRR